jgi:hypothetical protein
MYAVRITLMPVPVSSVVSEMFRSLPRRCRCDAWFPRPHIRQRCRASYRSGRTWNSPVLLSGWLVQIVHLEGMPDRCDGECLRIRQYGFWV